MYKAFKAELDNILKQRNSTHPDVLIEQLKKVATEMLTTIQELELEEDLISETDSYVQKEIVPPPKTIFPYNSYTETQNTEANQRLRDMIARFKEDKL